MLARFSTVFGLSNSQAGLDFVDIDISTDTPLYVCPYAIQIRDDEWSAEAGDHIRSFFSEVLNALQVDDDERAMHLLLNLHEPNETFLGESEGEPRGRAIGPKKARKLADAIKSSRAYETGLLADVSEAALYIHGVGRDTVSDLATNVIRGILAEYTKAECEIHGVPMQFVTDIGPVWDVVRRDWVAEPLELPIIAGRPILLVPKTCVRYKLSLDSQEFYNHHMIEFLKAEYAAAGGALVRMLKDGTPKVTKKSVKERHPLIKDDLAAFIIEHPDVLQQYKSLKGAEGPLSIGELEHFFDEPAFAMALQNKLEGIPSGNKDANAYHSLVMGILTFLFHPDLRHPIKEHEIYQGRKRIDIKYTNAATRGFFFRMLEAPQTRAISIVVECKNYSNDVANEAFDQLAGRFGHRRGFLGLLVSRSYDDRTRAIDRCKDAAADSGRYMLAFEDADLVALLQLVAAGHRPRIDRFMQDRFDEICG